MPLGDCNHDGCDDPATIRVVDAATGQLMEALCAAHAVSHARGIAARDRYLDEHGQDVIRLNVVVNLM